MSDGTYETFDVVYPVLGCNVRSELGKNLGARHNRIGCLEVDAHQQTTVEGLYAVGDVVSDLHQIAVGTGHAAVAAGHRVRYLTAAELVEQLYRGLADNSVGRVIDTLLRNDFVIVDEVGFAPLDDTGTQLLFRFVAAAYERRALGIASHWPFEQWGRFLPEHVTATSLLDRLLHHATVVVTEGESFRMREARTRTTRSRS